MSPPLREKKNQDVVWNGLRQRFVSTLATDRAPFVFSTVSRIISRLRRAQKTSSFCQIRESAGNASHPGLPT